MSEQVLDLRRFLRIVRRHKLVVAAITALGIFVGVGFTVLYPPMVSSDAVVAVPPTAARYIGTLVLVASSDPVLTRASRQLEPHPSLQQLRSDVVTKRLTSEIISITASGRTADKAENTANAVAAAYVAYLRTENSAVGKLQANIVNSASEGTGTPLFADLILRGGLGLLLGLLLGATVAIGIGRESRRLRSRDEIADAIGVPVLASLSVTRPTSAGGWTRLLEEYQPGPVQAWGLRKALYQLRLADASGGLGATLAVLSLRSDPGALAIGPQLAVFTASIGIPTTLLIGPQQDIGATATLRAACAVAPPGRSRRSPNLRVTVRDRGTTDWLPRDVLTIVVVAVDGEAPKIADTMPTTTTVVAVSAGAATGEQLARIAAGAAADDRRIAGILVADPDSDDETTGRFPVLARPEQGMAPTRLTGVTMETRR